MINSEGIDLYNDEINKNIIKNLNYNNENK